MRRKNLVLGAIFALSIVSVEAQNFGSIVTQNDLRRMIVRKDFNFDGKKDIALCEGMGGWKGDPVYSIYLADKENKKWFVYSESLTQILAPASSYVIDKKKKQIITTITANAGTHYVYTYTVENGLPVEVDFKEILD